MTATTEKSYTISMNVDIGGLTLPDSQGPTSVFFSILMQIMIMWGEQQGGAVMKDQKILYRIRQKLEAAVKTLDTRLVLDQEEYDFVNKCRTEAKLDFKANEAIIRVSDLVEKAVAK